MLKGLKALLGLRAGAVQVDAAAPVAAALEDAEAPASPKQLPDCLLPVLGGKNRAARRAWAQRHPQLWRDAWRYDALQEQAKKEGKLFPIGGRDGA